MITHQCRKAETPHFGMISASSTHNHISTILVYFKVITVVVVNHAPLNHMENAI